MNTQLRIAFPLSEPEMARLRELRKTMSAEEIEELRAMTREPDWPYPPRGSADSLRRPADG